jgi:hypothetical protein
VGLGSFLLFVFLDVLMFLHLTTSTNPNDLLSAPFVQSKQAQSKIRGTSKLHVS